MATVTALLVLALCAPLAASRAPPRAQPVEVKEGVAALVEALKASLPSDLPFLIARQGQATEPFPASTGIDIGAPAASWLEPWARAFFFKALQDAPALASWFSATIFNENPYFPGTDPRDWARIRPRVFELLVRGDLFNPVGFPLALQRLEDALRADLEEAREERGLGEGGEQPVLPIRGPLVGLRPLVNVGGK